MIDMREYALNSHYKKLIESGKKLEELSSSPLKKLFVPALKRFILEILSKDYINISVSFLKSEY